MFPDFCRQEQAGRQTKHTAGLGRLRKGSANSGWLPSSTVFPVTNAMHDIYRLMCRFCIEGMSCSCFLLVSAMLLYHQQPLALANVIFEARSSPLINLEYCNIAADHYRATNGMKSALRRHYYSSALEVLPNGSNPPCRRGCRKVYI